MCSENYTTDHVAALGHNYVGTYIPPTCDEEGYTLYTCSRCSDSFESDHIESLGHSLEYDHTVDPTCTEQGYDIYICSECGQEIYTNYIPALGHFWRLSPHGGSRICVRCGASDTVTPIDPPIGPIETEGTGDANEEQEGDKEVSDVVDSNEDEQSQPEAGVNELNETEDPTAGEEEQEERTIVASYDYIYAGDKLLQETVTSGNTTEVHQFFYDNNGTPYALMIDNTVYYYITNLQEDVVGLIDESGDIQATYSYDPYGKVLSATGPLADRNPLRYRGYYYYSETRFYYVSSRYYDPEICRWINADDVSYIGVGGDVLSYNLFAYCLNDPINRIDENGNWSLPNWAKIAIGTVALGVAIALTGATGVVSILQTVVFVLR